MSILNQYREAFGRLAPNLAQAAWLSPIRQAAIEQFCAKGLPTTQQEAWRYTRLTALEGRPFLPQLQAVNSLSNEQLAAWPLPDLDGHRLVFLDGHYQPQCSRLLPSLPASVVLTPLATQLQQTAEPEDGLLLVDASADAFAALNTAFMTDGLFLKIAERTLLEEPIHLLFISSQAQSATQLRNQIVLGTGSRATVVEHYLSFHTEPCFTNVVNELKLAEEAQLHLYKIQQENEQTVHINTTTAHQERKSHTAIHTFTLGGGLTRNNLHHRLAAPYANCQLHGLYLAQGRQHVDNNTLIEHLTPQGASRERYKGIINDRGRGVFNGKILVHQDAQGTDARLSNQNLLLAKGAEIDTKPELEIYADDVKCSHGATVGQLDPAALFYLRSRGFDEAQARDVLTYAFASELIETIPLHILQPYLRQTLAMQMGQGQGLLEIL